jgi:hypothetical protein
MRAALWVFGVAAAFDVTGRWLDRPDWWQPASVIALLAVAWVVRQHQDELRKAVWVPLFTAIATAELLIWLRWQSWPETIDANSYGWVAEPAPERDLGKTILHDLWRATPTLAILVGLVAAVLAMSKVRRLVAAGALVLVLPRLLEDGLDGLTRIPATLQAGSMFSGDAVVAYGVALSTGGGSDAVTQALYLAGLALIAIACVRPAALREADAVPG